MRIVLVGGEDAGRRPEDQAQGYPETAVTGCQLCTLTNCADNSRAKRSVAKCVTDHELTHSRKHLRQTTDSKRHTDNHVWVSQFPGLGIDEGEEECGGGKGEEAERAGVS